MTSDKGLLTQCEEIVSDLSRRIDEALTYLSVASGVDHYTYATVSSILRDHESPEGSS